MEAQLSFIIADLRNFTAKETLALALDVTANLQEDTPVDTGWARANWVPSLDAPFLDDGPSIFPGKPSPAQVAQASADQASAVGELLSYDLSKGAIFITNNVPYIIPLNEGHSKQAGRGFVQRAVGRALADREVAR